MNIMNKPAKTRLSKSRLMQQGASAIEYALLAAMVAVVIALFVTPIGDAILATLNDVLVALGGTAVTRP